MDGLRRNGAHAHHRAEEVGAYTQVGDFAEELHRMGFGLQGIFGRIGLAEDLDAGGLHLVRLAFSLAFDHRSFDGQARAGIDLLLGGQQAFRHDALQVLDVRSVIEGYKPVVAEGPCPSHYLYLLSYVSSREDVLYLGAFHGFFRSALGFVGNVSIKRAVRAVFLPQN